SGDAKKAAEAAFRPYPRNTSGRGLRFARVTLPEFLDPSRGVDDLLLARIERVAGGAHFHVERLVHGRARGERVSAAARHLNLAVLRMNTSFHRTPYVRLRADRSVSGD